MRRFFLLITPWLALSTAQSAEPIHFVHLTDTHVAALEGGLAAALTGFQTSLPQSLTMLFNSGETLPPTLERLYRQEKAQFAIISGDLTSAYEYIALNGSRIGGQVEAFERLCRRPPLPLYLALGNHDILRYVVSAPPIDDQAVAGEARAAWIRNFECFRNGTYYSLERRAGATRYTFLILDNGYYGGSLAGEVSRPGRDYRMAREQLYWLRRQVEGHAGDVLILVMHIPFGKDAMSLAIQAALAPRKRPAFILTGHTHKDDVVEELQISGQPPIYQVRTPAFATSGSHWRILCLFEDRVEVSVTGKAAQAARTVPLQLQAP